MTETETIPKDFKEVISSITSRYQLTKHNWYGTYSRFDFFPFSNF